MMTKLFAAALPCASLPAQARLSAPVSAGSGLGTHSPGSPLASLQGDADTFAGEGLNPGRYRLELVVGEGRLALPNDKPDGLYSGLAVVVQTQ